MNAKKGGGDRLLKEITGYENFLELMEDNFNRGNKLDRAAVINYQQHFLSAYSAGIRDPETVIARVNRIPHYLERAQREYEFQPEVYELIKQRSDPEAVAALDQLIDEFKTDFPRIIKERDKKSIEKFMDRAIQLLK